MLQKTLFDIPIWIKEVDNFEYKKGKLDEELSKFPEVRNDTNSFFSNRGTQREGLSKTFANIMSKELHELQVNLKEYKPEINEVWLTDVWSVTYQKGDYQATHNHRSTGLSGLLHLEIPTDGPQLNIIMPWNDWINDTTTYYSVKYKVGTMMVMPSFLLHSSEVNLSEERKRVISWDMRVE
tara:strand:- start:269 stop:811 length:543 start_codon:yes stop_codon:yes gene_type:complete